MLCKTFPIFYAEYERTHNIIGNLHRFEAETPLTAMSQVTKEIFMENTDFFPIMPVDYGRFLVISLGTGSNKQEGRFTAQESSKRGVLSGCTTRAPPPSSTSSRNGRPRLCSLSSAVIGEAVPSHTGTCTLTGDAASLDITGKENLEKLVKVGKELLGKPVTRVNLENGNYEPVEEEGRNEEALTCFAQRLSSERKLRNSKLLP
ncbi:patatin-like protein 2 [Musa acuminata AAA Group]|uniref:patatin-like protein 2 n=1 Tax=Musa acuminata AAA Group TaxID=214697 RepID=UPI0031D62109